MKKVFRRILYFLKMGVWEVQTKDLKFYNRFAVNVIRTVILSFKGFKKDECPIRASALTYFTLLSIVPVIAVAFAIAKGFGLEQVLEDEITKALAAQKEVMTYLLDFSKRMLTSTKSGLLAIISIGFLLYTVLRLFHQIENAVNTIWSVEKSRSFLRKFTDYLSIVVIAPILMIASSAATVYINAIVKDLSKDSILEMISPFLLSSMKLLPFIIMWLLFTFMYMVMPNKRVKFKRTFIAGIIAGTFFQLIQIYYIDLQFAFSRYNAVYGSFAALPLFFIWVQASWIVFLFGAEVSSVLGNIQSYGYRIEYNDLSNKKKRLLSLLILKKITNRFERGEAAPGIEQLADELKLPHKYVEKITENLVKSKMVNEVLDSSKKGNGFQPAKDISKQSFAEAFEKLDVLGDNRLNIKSGEDFENLDKQLRDFLKLINENYSKVLIKNI